MDDCPVEILEYITSFCDDKSILNLNKVNVNFYLITKKRKSELIEFFDFAKLMND